MTNRIGDGGGAMAREAILAAMKSQAKSIDEVRGTIDPISGSTQETKGAAGFAEALGQTIRSIDEQVKGVDNLPKDLLTGQVDDFHEVAVKIKKAEFTFRFAMEMRNKLIEAYREVMRMNV